MPKVKVADPQQTIADLRRELALSNAERDEALAQQTAAAEVLQVINSSPGDLAPVFDAMLEKAMRLCGGSFGVLAIYEGEHYRIAANRGLPPALAEFVEAPITIEPGGMPDRLRRGDDVIQLPDIAAVEPEHRTPGLIAMIELGRARTALWVALRKDGVTQGFFGVYRQEVRPFTDKQIALLQNFAAQAVIAMENARLITETREALEQQTATAEVLQVINSSPGDLAPVFDAILEKAHTLCGAVHGALVSFDGKVFRAVATRGMPAPFDAYMRSGFPLVPGSPVDQLLRGEPAHFPDFPAFAAASPPEMARLAQTALELAGTRTLLLVPLRKDDALLGYIAAYRLEVQPFTDKQIALLQNFAAQAVIAMENARLITETREALEQQTATAEVLGVINASPGDLAPVFDAMLEKAMTLCGAAFGALMSYDGERVCAVATRGLPAELAEVFREPIAPRREGDAPYARFLRGEPLLHIADMAAEDVLPSLASRPRALVEIGGARTGLEIPLRKEGALRGSIWLYRQEVRPFTDKQIALLQNFAAQAVIAMENARLLTETREALDQQTATAEVLGVINSSPGDLAPVFDAILEKAHTLCGAALGSLVLRDGEDFRAVATRGYSREYDALARAGFPARAFPPFDPLSRGEILHHPDVREFAKLDSVTHAAVEIGGIRTVLLVPLRKEAALLGYISAQRQEIRPFTDKQIALLQNFAAQAVIAMENARLLGELRARTDEVAGWNRELEARVATQLAEIERTGKLRRFLAPQLADLILAQGDESILESHRREIVVVFCDLRGFTAFAERAEPEEVMALLKDYHAAMGPIVASFEGTLDHYAGDGIMVFFNDPLPTPDPARRAIDMAVAMRLAAQDLLRSWRRHGHEIGFGVGISQGYATLGQIGFAERMDYTAIGTVTNLAARLCAEAKDGQILVSRRVAIAVEDSATLEEIGDLSLKGLSQAVLVYNVPLSPA